MWQRDSGRSTQDVNRTSQVRSNNKQRLQKLKPVFFSCSEMKPIHFTNYKSLDDMCHAC